MRDKILELLKQGQPEYVSGEAICQRLGVSRTAVWKHIQSLRSMGYEIEAVTNAGYRLIGVPDRLYPAEIGWGLKTSFMGRHVHYCERLDSTNRLARELAARGVPEGTLVVAEEQTGGRGRLGRGWFSPYAKGIWCSLILRPSLSPLDAPPLTMLAAVAVAEALQRAAGLKPGIKWPNDLLAGGRKLCGILTELDAEVEKVNHLIVGIGVNVNIAPGEFPPDLAETATSVLAVTGRRASRVRLLQEMLAALEYWYLRWQKEGFSPVLSRWKEYSVTLGRAVLVTSHRESYEGWAEDVDESGSLILRLPGGQRQKICSGEVSLRPLHDQGLI
ncbi:biotin--[acetyl-CoA-carboxylase] ligase [Desulfovirgula thermocuniculi]|uniref:biotin--[acetyl-CoA-carboxylase] ligase n=1 Tax=Desulfovirgula thermocuniculi TaxID=348842 RepID=UPI00040E96C0|nr:biotin--[acetyl-CoA-carboxylase] ligase [Desulfovirgula thermocuniculi]